MGLVDIVHSIDHPPHRSQRCPSSTPKFSPSRPPPSSTALARASSSRCPTRASRGKWSVLIFMPAASPSTARLKSKTPQRTTLPSQAAGAEVYIVTTDTHFSHKVWHETSPGRRQGQVPAGRRPDPHPCPTPFGVHIPEEGPGCAAPSSSTPDGVIKTAEVHSNEIARDVSETPAQAEGRPVHGRQPWPGLPGQVEGRRKTLAPPGPRRQDLTPTELRAAAPR